MSKRHQSAAGLHPVASAVLLVLAVSAISVRAAPTPEHPLGDWVTHNGNIGHTGYVPLYSSQAAMKVRWSTTIPGGLALNPVAVARGHVFVTQNGWFDYQTLNALDLQTGQVQWSYTFSSPVFGGLPILNAPAVKDGMVVVTTGGADDAALWGFDQVTGAQRFRSPLGNQWEHYLAPVPFGTNVYTEDGAYGGIASFQGSTGTQHWWTSLPQYDTWTPAVDASHVYAYTTELDAIDSATGTVQYTIPDPNFNWNGYAVDCAPALGASSNAVVTQGGRVISFDLANHKIGWEVAGDYDSSYHGQVSLAGHQVFVAKTYTVEVRDDATGALLGTWTPGGIQKWARINSNIVVTKNLFFVSTQRGVDAVSRTGLKRVAHFAQMGQLSMSRDGVLLISGEDGTVTAIDTHPMPQ